MVLAYDFSTLKALASSRERMASLPEQVRAIMERAISEVDPSRIYLFGSRVRGDFHAASDIDIGFELDDRSHGWSRFNITEPERARTLLQLDLVNFSDAHSSLREYVLHNGVLIYERPNQVEMVPR
jgi:CRISPR-associated protein Cmr1